MRLIQTVGALFQPAPHVFLVPRITIHTPSEVWPELGIKRCRQWEMVHGQMKKAINRGR